MIDNVSNDQNANQSESNDNQIKVIYNQNPINTENTIRKCGWFCLTPDNLQNFRTPKWVLFWLCWAGALQGKFYIYTLIIMLIKSTCVLYSNGVNLI